MNNHSTLTPAQTALVEEWTRAGIGQAEQSRRLELPVSRIMSTRRKILASGQAPARARPAWRTWSGKEIDQLINLVEQGRSYPQIARTLKRTQTSITLKCKRLDIRITTTCATMSARDAAEALGIPCSKTIAAWIRRGWLQARDAGTGRVLWRITWEDLTAFLENPTYWVAWRPDRIPDLALREWAQELRAGEEPLLEHTAIAQRLGVGRDTIGNWLDRGYLPIVRYGNRRVPASAIEGFVPPCDRQIPMSDHGPREGKVPIGHIGGVTFYRFVEG